jgi:REP element-mobilizing transposase RayT
MIAKEDAPYFYRRRLPHLIPYGGTFFVTFRLADSMPKAALEVIRQRRISKERVDHRLTFNEYDDLLDHDTSRNHLLKDSRVAAIVKDAIHFHERISYDLWCYCLMSNHVHMVLTHREGAKPLNRVLGSIKQHTARRANRLLNRSGNFWQEENYDHLVRDEYELNGAIAYVVNNPVKAGLVAVWSEWPHSYIKPGVWTDAK